MPTPDAAARPALPMDLTAAQRWAAMRSTILGQCAGTVGSLVFTNGLMLLYLTALGMGPAATMLSLALHDAIRGLLTVPAAYWCDRLGIKRVGYVGLCLTIAGYAIIAAAGWFEGMAGRTVVVGGISLYTVGSTLFSSGWVALLSGFVTAESRGRFFGSLRFACQAVAIAFAGVATLLLPRESSAGPLQLVMAIILIGQVDRLWHYRRLPERVGPRPPRAGLLEALAEIVRAPQYMGFCAYTFLLGLFTANAPVLFALIEKDVLGLGDRAVAMMGVALMVGSLIGFAAGGWIVDRVGARSVFLLCHLGYGLVLALFPLRGSMRASMDLSLLVLAGLNLVYGLISAASSIAISTEMLALAPPQRKSLSTGLCGTLLSAGAALSGILASAMIGVGMLQPHWQLAGLPLSQYDAVLLTGAVMIVLLVVALSLVPAVVAKAQWVPKGDA